MLKSVDSEEVSSFVNSSRSERASGHRLRHVSSKFWVSTRTNATYKNLWVSIIVETRGTWWSWRLVLNPFWWRGRVNLEMLGAWRVIEKLTRGGTLCMTAGDTQVVEEPNGLPDGLLSRAREGRGTQTCMTVGSKSTTLKKEWCLTCHFCVMKPIELPVWAIGGTQRATGAEGDFLLACWPWTWEL